MKKILIIFLAIGVVVLLWLFSSRFAGNPTANDKSVKSADKSASPNPVPKSPSIFSEARQLLAGKYPRWEGGRSTDLSDPRWKIMHEREKLDRAWMGKIEIEFHGKVVDENDQPVEGALVHFSKGDLSEAGTTQLERRTDFNGRVSLIGVLGRGMSARAEKTGYYSSRLDRHYFEYALFSDENFYQPDSSNPIIFRLKKRQAADPLLYREREVKVAIGAMTEVTLDTGEKLQIELLANPRPGQGQWSMRISVLNGGLQTSVEEFPFLAPSNDYQSNLVLDSKTPKPLTWESLYEGGSLFLKAGSTYGRMEIQTISGRDWIRIKSWLNPKPSSRNLEFDPAKVAKP